MTESGHRRRRPDNIYLLLFVFTYICVEYVSPRSEGDRCICKCTLFSCYKVGPLHVTKLRRDRQSALVSPGDGNPLSGVAGVDLPSHNTCGS